MEVRRHFRLGVVYFLFLHSAETKDYVRDLTENVMTRSNHRHHPDHHRQVQRPVVWRQFPATVAVSLPLRIRQQCPAAEQHVWALLLFELVHQNSMLVIPLVRSIELDSD